MFKFNKVEDQRSGKAYIVKKAVFAGDEYDKEPDGLNWYHVELDPEDPEDPEDPKEVPFPSVDVIISNDGQIHISKDLHGERYKKRFDELLNISISEAVTVAAVMDGEMLIIPKAQEDDGLVFLPVDRVACLRVLKGSEVQYIFDGKGADGRNFITITFKERGNYPLRDLRIYQSGPVFLSEPY